MRQTERFLLFITLLILATGCKFKSADSTQSANNNANEYELVWADEFDYEGLPDSTRWIYDTAGNEYGWGNREAQHYTAGETENAFVSDGLLKITALKKEVGDKKYTSARIITSRDFQYGKIEVSAKLPSGVGTWPAIWMMPGGWSFTDGNWPDVGEIDIMEHVGYDPGVVHSSAHSKDYQWQIGTQKTGTINVPTASSAFNTYIFEWTPEILRTYVNDSLFFEYKNEGLGETKWPYDKPYYLILNLAVGGEWGSVKGIDDDCFPQVMEVDFVRIYSKSENILK